MEKVILHSDMNNFFAAVECLYNPAIREKPVVVGGDAEARHGIVLAKNYIAKKYGIATGEALWQAKQKCKDIVVVPPSYDKYMHFSNVAREIYYDYTDMIESFGIDECWLDVSGSTHLFGDGKAIADKIRDRIKKELGVTNSVGVSYNKIFAKLGSDMKKPDATTVITKADFKEKIWTLPVSDLLYVGSATNAKLMHSNINTIGDLAKMDINYLERKLGKWGGMLWLYANGIDGSSVKNIVYEQDIKSIGNSTTAPRDLISDEDVKIIAYVLAESVAARLRQDKYACRTIQIWVRDKELNSYERQETLKEPTCISKIIADKSMELFRRNHKWGVHKPLRSFGVRACNLVPDGLPKQLSFFTDEKTEKMEHIEYAVEKIRNRFGNYAVQRGMMLIDSRLSHFNPKDEHVIHPVAYTK